MERGVILCLSFLLWLYSSNACHIYENEGHEIRRKRDTSKEAEQTQILRKYFTDCMTNVVGASKDWQTIIDTSILDTHWYENSDDSYCSASDGRDTTECWINRLPAYLREDDELVAATSQCIEQYSHDVSEGRTQFQGLRSRDETESRKKRQVPEEGTFSLLSTKVEEYIACCQTEVQLPTNRDSLDFASLVQFIQESTTCSPELLGCGPDGTETLSGLFDVPSWPYRFQVLIKPTSPLNAGIIECNERIFPLEPPTEITTPLPVSPTISLSTTPRPGPVECALLDLVIVMDSSSSIGSDNFETERDLVKRLISRIPVSLEQIKVAGVRFNKHPTYVWGILESSNSDTIITKVDSLMYAGNGTRIMRALWRVRKETFTESGGDRENAPNMVILLTDGRTTDNLAYRAPRFRRAARARTVVVPINRYKSKKINLLASPPYEENVFMPDRVDDLVSLVNNVAYEACNEE